MYGPTQKKQWDSVLQHLSLPMMADGAEVIAQDVTAAFVQVTLGFTNPVLLEKIQKVLEHTPDIGKVHLISLNPPSGTLYYGLAILLRFNISVIMCRCCSLHRQNAERAFEPFIHRS